MATLTPAQRRRLTDLVASALSGVRTAGGSADLVDELVGLLVAVKGLPVQGGADDATLAAIREHDGGDLPDACAPADPLIHADREG